MGIDGPRGGGIAEARGLMDREHHGDRGTSARPSAVGGLHHRAPPPVRLRGGASPPAAFTTALPPHGGWCRCLHPPTKVPNWSACAKERVAKLRKKLDQAGVLKVNNDTLFR